ncbi:MAG: intracellular septation protein [Caulobacter sp.]|nr:intracellular septation protein [Caulobacter sp.]
MKHYFHAIKWLAADLLSTLFFVALYSLTHNAILATGVGIATGVAQVLYQAARRRPIDTMQWLSLGLVVVFGGATLITHDSRFIMFKPTLIYLAVAAAMLKPGWMNRYLPPIVLEHSPDVGRAFGYVWAAMMAGTAVANAVIALTCDMPTWAMFVAVFPIASKIVLFIIQAVTLRIITGDRVRAKRSLGILVEA